MQQACVAGAFRLVPYQIIPLEELGLPAVCAELTEKPRGLVLVTGPTGSGKSTTLASMIDRINTRMRGHIVTVEDPIEFQHTHKACLVNQREIGRDSQSFKRALKYILRQDPDVVLIGEMRDLETIEAALAVAETGHLCFGTLHTNSAIQSINRIVDAFPSHSQSQVRAVLSFVLEGVITQTLIPKINGTGRVLASEVMVPNAAIRNLIREDKLHQVYSQMQIGQTKYGMQTLNQSLCDLYVRKMISLEDALGHSSEVDELKTMILNAGGSLGSMSPPTSNPGRR
jgi:twitching motility protein PilT